MTYRVFPLLALLVLVQAASDAAEDLVSNGDFSAGPAGWDGIVTAADHEVSIVDAGGRTSLVLKRISAGAGAQVSHWNLKLKPQTWYRLSAVGVGVGPAVVSLRLQSAKDPEYDPVAKGWALATCPMPASTAPVTESLVIDSGLKPDSGFVNLRLEGSDPTSYTFQSVSLTELGSSKPDAGQTIVAHLGDSITLTSYLPFSQRIDAVLASLVAQAMPQRVVHQMNLAADGEFVADLLDTHRYQKVVGENFRKIDIAVIRYGANDQIHNFTPDAFKKQVATLCDDLERDYPGIAIVLGTGPYVHAAPDVNKQYGAHWQALRDLAAERKYPLADIYQRFEREASVSTARAPGDMHPSAYGAKLAAEVELAVIQPLLSRAPSK